MKIKRYFAAALVLMCLCGCNSGNDLVPATGDISSTAAPAVEEVESAAEETESASENTESADAVALSDVFKKIGEEVELPDMVELNDKLLMRYYGIDAADVADYAGGVDSSGVGQDEIVIIKAADESKVEGIEKALQTRYDSKLTQQDNYNPDEAEKIRGCKVETSGLYVTLIISNDADTITGIVKDAIA